MLNPKIEVSALAIHEEGRQLLGGVDLAVRAQEIFAITGPANGGKSVFLQALNRMDAMRPGMRVSGVIRIDGIDIRRWRNVQALRRRIGVVSPLLVALPLSVYDNVALAPRLAGIAKGRAELDEWVEQCLQRAVLWDEVKDRLHHPGNRLSVGQQQRLILARALAQRPEILLLDEFARTIDPVMTLRIEEGLRTLQAEMTILLATRQLRQVRRLADRVAFFFDGTCVEIGECATLFDGGARDARTIDHLERSCE